MSDRQLVRTFAYNRPPYSARFAFSISKSLSPAIAMGGHPKTAFVFLIAILGCLTPSVLSQRLYENDDCRPGGRWKCKPLRNCLWGQAEIRKGKNPMICSFYGREPLVCCPEDRRPPPTTTARPASGGAVTRPPTARPPPQEPSAGAKSRAMCKKWADTVVVWEEPLSLMPWDDAGEKIKIDNCGQIEEPLIVGGLSAKGKEFPHMGTVGYKENPTKWLCGCTLISEKFVITAAHCTDGGIRWGPAKWVRLGELDFDSDVDDARPVVFGIKRRINHPGYVSDQGYNDIALFELDTTVTFNAYIRPACLHTTWDINYNTSIATGWGHLEYGGKQSSDLRKVRINLVPTDVCQAKYGTATKIPQGINNATMLCAGDEEGKDTCQGDSGGPLQVPLKDPYCMYDIVGITSFGKPCGSAAPGVYTRVSYYIPWIEGIVWP